MKVLVTGAAGFIGSHLVDGLLAAGHTVRGLDNLTTGTRDNLTAAQDNPAFTFIEGDIRDRDTLNQALGDVEYVFHHAARASVQQSFSQPATLSDVNCRGTALLFEEADSANVTGLVFASSAAVYGTTETLPVTENTPVAPESPYGASKRYGEQLAMQLGDRYDIQTTVFRYFNVFGPRQDPTGEYAAVIPKFITRMQNGKQPIIYGDGEQSRDFIFVEDVVRANRLAMNSPDATGIYNIGRGDRHSINTLVKTLNEVLETTLEPIHETARPGEIRHSEASISRAQDVLNFQPHIGFKEGLRRTSQAFRTHD